ncbi:MAG TPA: AEC family transporter [Candidatus Bathyarchaeota archaeon]|nr:AEC family transporter [Candidatus Bathyarchaeota archaeon]
MVDVLVGTAVPILFLMGTGFLSRKVGILKQGDERVLSAYVYFFALPALFFVDLAETSFVAETVSFIFAGIIPIFVVVAIYVLLYALFRFSKNTLYLLTLSTVFGSLAFFGIPFITFAYPPGQSEQLATLAAATIGIAAIAVSIATLEFYRLGESLKMEGLKQVAKGLSRNPLIISIVLGILVSIVGVQVPSPVAAFLHMLGGTTSAVAVFMLGAFLYGKKYINMKKAFGLSLLRIVFLPILALAILMLFNLPSMEHSVLVLMHGMPVAVSLSVLSQRYNFYKETIASLTLISSVGALIYLNIWLIILGA